jgi:hypothetical protein
MFIGHPKGCRWIPRKNEIVRDRIMKKWESKLISDYYMLSARMRESRDYYISQIEWREKSVSTGLYDDDKDIKLQTEIDYIKSTILPDFEYKKQYLRRSW